MVTKRFCLECFWMTLQFLFWMLFVNGTMLNLVQCSTYFYFRNVLWMLYERYPHRFYFWCFVNLFERYPTGYYACLYTFYKFYLIYSYISSQLSVRFKHHLSFYVLQWVFLSLIKKLVIKSVLWPTNSYPLNYMV
jgi:hypothetical protein